MKKPKAAVLVIAEPRPANAKARRKDMGMEAPRREAPKRKAKPRG